MKDKPWPPRPRSSYVLQIATEFASVGSVILPSKPIQLAAEDKLAALRRLDKAEHGIASTIESIAA